METTRSGTSNAKDRPAGQPAGTGAGPFGAFDAGTSASFMQVFYRTSLQDTTLSGRRGRNRPGCFMVGVFTLEKKRSYLEETERQILPMLKRAERNFPEQEPAYKNIRTVLKMQVSLVDALLRYQGV